MSIPIVHLFAQKLTNNLETHYVLHFMSKNIKVTATVFIKENGLYLTNVFPEKRFSIIVCLQLNIKIRQRFRLLTT